MQQNGGDIWGLIQQSTFNTHFQCPDLKIQQLLADENIITEMKNLNPQLLQYIANNRQQVFERMVEYATVMPMESDGKDRGYLFPYVSSEILAIDSDTIYSAFLKDCSGGGVGSQGAVGKNPLCLSSRLEPTKHWFSLLAILENDEAVDNPVMLGYFTKILCNLYKGCKLQFTRIILQDEKTRKSFIRHLNQPTVGEVVKDLFVLLETPEGKLLDQRKVFLKQILFAVTCPISEDQSRKQQVRQVICEQILTPVITKFQTFSSGEELLDHLLQLQQFPALYALHGSLAVMQLLTNMLQKSKQTISTAQDWKKEYMFVIPQIHRNSLQKYTEEHLQILVGKYQGENVAPGNLNQNKCKVRITHPQILRFCELLVELADNNIKLSFGSCSCLVQLMFRVMMDHPFNDILQTKIVRVLEFFSTLKLSDKNQPRNQELLQCMFMQFTKLVSMDSLNHRPHLYRIWKTIKSNAVCLGLLNSMISNNKFEGLSIEEWKKAVGGYFGHLQKVQGIKWGTHLKGNFGGKIVVDQQEKYACPNPNSQSEMLSNNSLEINKPIQSISESPKEKDNTENAKEDIPSESKPKEIEKGAVSKDLSEKSNKKEIDKFASFDFFTTIGNTPKTAQKGESKKQEEQAKKTKATFDAFANFGFN